MQFKDLIITILTFLLFTSTSKASKAYHVEVMKIVTRFDVNCTGTADDFGGSVDRATCTDILDNPTSLKIFWIPRADQNCTVYTYKKTGCPPSVGSKGRYVMEKPFGMEGSAQCYSPPIGGFYSFWWECLAKGEPWKETKPAGALD